MPNGSDTRRLSELTVEDAKRVVVYAAAVALAVWLFVALVGKVLVALLLGVVAAVYLFPRQEWLERRLRARAGSALITIALIVVPLASLVGYSWYELSGYSNVVRERQEQIIEAISEGVERYVPVSRQGTRAGLEVAFAEAVTRSAEAVEVLRQRAPLILASLTVFFFTVFYVLTQRVRLAAYVKLRVPGEFHPLYEQLTKNIGGALRGALQAVFIDQLIKGVVIFTLNVVFDVPLALVLAIVTFLMGFFPLVGEWLIYIPVAIYLLVFRDAPTSAAIYFTVGVVITVSSSLLLRPRLAASGSNRFNFYWMLVALVAGVYTFGIPGIVLGPAILGFVKAVADTLLGDTRYETSLLKEERVQQAEQAEAAEAERGQTRAARAGD
jgi:predicted PurR-regulated permease PerM